MPKATRRPWRLSGALSARHRSPSRDRRPAPVSRRAVRHPFRNDSFGWDLARCSSPGSRARVAGEGLCARAAGSFCSGGRVHQAGTMEVWPSGRTDLTASRPPQTRLGRGTVARDGATVTSDALNLLRWRLTLAPFPTASPDSWASTAGAVHPDRTTSRCLAPLGCGTRQGVSGEVLTRLRSPR